MAEFELVVDNTQEILRTLDSKIFKALTECGLVAEGYAKLKCPVDTGALRNSISNKVATESENVTTCYVGTNMEYAPYIEYGTGIHVSGGRRTPWVYKDKNGWHMTHGQKPRPFLRPSIADHIEQYKKIIERELKNAL